MASCPIAERRGAAAAAALAACALPAPALADPTDPPKPVELDARLGLVSDYRLRGISQSNRRPAVQGSVGATHISGLYARIEGSSIAGRVAPGADAQIDLIAGYETLTASGIGLDFGLRYYLYPGGDGATDFVEPYAAVSYTLGPATADLRVHYAPKQRALARDGRKRDNLYARAGLASAVPGTPLTARAHVGRDFGGSDYNLATRYTEWGLGLSYVAGPLTFGLDYADTNRAVRTPGGRTLGGAGLVGSLRVGF